MYYAHVIPTLDQREKNKTISTTRGLWQGDPLSPYPFIILADVLSRQVKEIIRMERFRGLTLKRACPELHHPYCNNQSYGNQDEIFSNGCLKLFLHSSYGSVLLRCYQSSNYFPRVEPLLQNLSFYSSSSVHSILQVVFDRIHPTYDHPSSCIHH